jgi:hypothetical protein
VGDLYVAVDTDLSWRSGRCGVCVFGDAGDAVRRVEMIWKLQSELGLRS